MGYTFDERMTALGPHVHEGVPQAASAAGVPLRTAERWLTAYLTRGAAGLRRAGRADKGRHRLPDELLEVIEGMALCRTSAARGRGSPGSGQDRRRAGLEGAVVHRRREVIAGLDRGLLALAHHDGIQCHGLRSLQPRDSARPSRQSGWRSTGRPGSTPVAVGETTTPPPGRSIRLGFGDCCAAPGLVQRSAPPARPGPGGGSPPVECLLADVGGGRIPQLRRQMAARMRGLDAQQRGSKGYRSGVRAADRHGAARVRGVDPRRDHHQRNCRAPPGKGVVIMASSVPAGDESRVDAASGSVVDPESAAATELEPDSTAHSAPGAADEPCSRARPFRTRRCAGQQSIWSRACTSRRNRRRFSRN